MKKIRRTKIIVKTARLVFARQAAAHDGNGQTENEKCPLCGQFVGTNTIRALPVPDTNEKAADKREK